MNERIITASRFKAECLGLLDDVARTHRELVVTKYGRPVARVVPAGPAIDLRGSVTFLVDDDELVEPLDVEWDAERG
jgi:prevent-host-death family protein